MKIGMSRYVASDLGLARPDWRWGMDVKGWAEVSRWSGMVERGLCIGGFYFVSVLFYFDDGQIE